MLIFQTISNKKGVEMYNGEMRATGVSGDFITGDKVYGIPKFDRQVFFRPYCSKYEVEDAVYRATSVITAPVTFLWMALTAPLSAVILPLFMLFYPIKDAPKPSLIGALKVASFCLIGCPASLIMAVLSPVINLIDLVVSGIKTLMMRSESRVNPSLSSTKGIFSQSNTLPSSNNANESIVKEGSACFI
jgi:hypothetical protein